jgi:hypothetical protein
MMKNVLNKHLLVAIAATALLSACGGGRGGPSPVGQGPGNEEPSDLLAIVKAMVSLGGVDTAEPQPIDGPKANTSEDKEPDPSV